MKLAALLFFVAYATHPAGSVAQTPPPRAALESTLEISGDATVERDPDLARVNAEIVTNDDVAARSAGKNAAIFEALKMKLAALGIAGAAIRTRYFNVTFVPRPVRAQPGDAPQRYGYVTTRSLGIAVTPIQNAGKIVDASLAAGVSQVGDVAFELKDRKSAYRDALGRAFADAKANATALVANSELRLVRVQTISAGNYSSVPPRPFDGMQLRAAVAAPLPPTQIDPNGPIDVTAHVTVTYVVRAN